MSKVIHLSNEAHGLAKQYCKSKGLKMSDWVGALIMDAVSASEPREAPEPVVEPQPVVVEQSNAPKKKKLPSIDDSLSSDRWNAGLRGACSGLSLHRHHRKMIYHLVGDKSK